MGMWMWGDENPLATYNPLRWSEYMIPKDLAKNIGECTQARDNNRPIKIKDLAKGNWAFKNAAQAMTVLERGHDLPDDAYQGLADEAQEPLHLRFQQQTSIKARTLDPE